MQYYSGRIPWIKSISWGEYSVQTSVKYMTRPTEKISTVLKLYKAVTQPLYGTDIAIMVLWYLGAIYHVVQRYHQIIMVPVVLTWVPYSGTSAWYWNEYAYSNTVIQWYYIPDGTEMVYSNSTSSSNLYSNSNGTTSWCTQWFLVRGSRRQPAKPPKLNSTKGQKSSGEQEVEYPNAVTKGTVKRRRMGGMERNVGTFKAVFLRMRWEFFQHTDI